MKKKNQKVNIDNNLDDIKIEVDDIDIKLDDIKCHKKDEDTDKEYLIKNNT